MERCKGGAEPMHAGQRDGASPWQQESSRRGGEAKSRHASRRPAASARSGAARLLSASSPRGEGSRAWRPQQRGAWRPPLRTEQRTGVDGVDGLLEQRHTGRGGLGRSRARPCLAAAWRLARVMRSQRGAASGLLAPPWPPSTAMAARPTWPPSRDGEVLGGEEPPPSRRRGALAPRPAGAAASRPAGGSTMAWLENQHAHAQSTRASTMPWGPLPTRNS
jgi:hypothetical protein